MHRLGSVGCLCHSVRSMYRRCHDKVFVSLKREKKEKIKNMLTTSRRSTFPVGWNPTLLSDTRARSRLAVVYEFSILVNGLSAFGIWNFLSGSHPEVAPTRPEPRPEVFRLSSPVKVRFYHTKRTFFTGNTQSFHEFMLFEIIAETKS